MYIIAEQYITVNKNYFLREMENFHLNILLMLMEVQKRFPTANQPEKKSSAGPAR